MDVIVEGKITKDEGIKEVLQTVLDLKQVFNPVLRITQDDGLLEGRIGFCRGGFILGGEVSNKENGWTAIKSLLEIKEGNYAILEPKSDNVPEVNQSLWIKVERIMPLLNNLPSSPDVLLVADTTKGISPAKITVSKLDSIRPDVQVATPKTPVVEPKLVNPALNNYQVEDNFKYGSGLSLSPAAITWIIGGFLAIALAYFFVGFLAHSLSTAPPIH